MRNRKGYRGVPTGLPLASKGRFFYFFFLNQPFLQKQRINGSDGLLRETCSAIQAALYAPGKDDAS